MDFTFTDKSDMVWDERQNKWVKPKIPAWKAQYYTDKEKRQEINRKERDERVQNTNFSSSSNTKKSSGGYDYFGKWKNDN
eukprot:CAMPEP_0114597036 /NCGR_PEP_ID=MMETSP0125-20121206/19265_1 /TAXON_ID=485358 ORGANISM="Aristerostoma sp., Strain ATCC 50986" /NCGR_SAMPLE_ID=MMETSP0125 /ASSEMBLY_ACC=CAM_ASM_000245 /LENGTH=79 /DNA_ID=CAMNT_0001801083 /DNA_START=69 /DNA_END=308 /DNA_ORIENTATION=-